MSTSYTDVTVGGDTAQGGDPRERWIWDLAWVGRKDKRYTCISVFDNLPSSLPYLIGLVQPCCCLAAKSGPYWFFWAERIFHILTKIMSMRCRQRQNRLKGGSRKNMLFGTNELRKSPYMINILKHDAVVFPSIHLSHGKKKPNYCEWFRDIKFSCQIEELCLTVQC